MAKWTSHSTPADISSFSNDPRVRKEARRRRVRILIIATVVLALLGLSAKPAYDRFRTSVVNRNLEDARAAARVEDWGTARNLARAVLLARPGDFDAYRIWFRALSHMGEPRTYLVAASLFVDPKATRDDRLEALGVMARQAPQAVALGAYASLEEDLRQDPAAIAALSPLLTLRGETDIVEKVLRNSPDNAKNPAIQLELIRSLCSRPSPDRVAEARQVFASLIAEKAGEPALDALLLLSDTEGGLAPGSPLPPLPEWVATQPKATTLHHLVALHPAILASPASADEAFQAAISRFIDIDPGVLGTWLIRHKRAARAITALVDHAKTSPSAFVAYLNALAVEKRHDEALTALAKPPPGCDLVDLELARAAVARLRNDAPGENAAWNEALNHAAFDTSRNRFIEIAKYASLLGVTRAVDDAWVAGVRVGWGQIPLYFDLAPIFASLANQNRSEDLLAIYRTLLRFEPLNPELINNFYYLGVLHNVAPPAVAIDALEKLTTENPKSTEFRSALAMAYLIGGQPEATLQQIPTLKASTRVPPPMTQALEGTARILLGQTDAGSEILKSVNWRAFLRIEAVAFNQILIKLQLANLPLPPLEIVKPLPELDDLPAWRKAVERLEKARENDTLPPLPAPKIPSATRPAAQESPETPSQPAEIQKN